MKYDLKGYNIDNLLKTLYAKKIVMYNIVRPEHNRIIFEVNDKQAKKVKRYIANFKVTQTLSTFKRLPKIMIANLGLILGVFFGIIFGIFASNYTWQIKVYGLKDLTETQIVQVLKDNNVKVGKINLQTSEEIEDILLNNYDKIAQVSVIRVGTAIIINLSEKLVYIEEEFQPIVAKHSGIIKEIKVITGTTNVKVGDYVNAGDILILPFNLDANNKKVSVKPLAEIYAEMFVLGKTSVCKYEKVLKRTGNKQITYNYKLFNLNLFSGKSKNSFALFETDVYNENISDLIPFKRDVVTFYELNYFEVEHNFENEKQSLLQQSKDIAYKSLPVGDIVNETSSTYIVDEEMFAVTTISVLGIIHD